MDITQKKMEEILIPISFFASVFGILYVYLTTRHRERLALIEKGADPEIFKSAFKGTLSSRLSSFTLKLGLAAVGVALGIITGSILFALIPNLQEEIAMFSMIFLFGGSAMIASYFLERKLAQKDIYEKWS